MQIFFNLFPYLSKQRVKAKSPLRILRDSKCKQVIEAKGFH